MSDDTTPVPTPDEKKGRQMSFTLVETTGEIRADFEGLDPLFLNPALVPEHVQAAAMLEGLKSRARSYTSKLVDDKRTPVALREVIEKAFANFLTGTWDIAREGAGGTQVTIEAEAAWLFRKLRAESQGKEFTDTLADVVEAFAKLTDDPKTPDGKPVLGPDNRPILGQKSQLKALPRYQVAYAQVKAERAVAHVAALAKKAAEAEAEENAPL